MMDFFGAAPDLYDSYFHESFPAWCRWIAGGSFILGFCFINRNEKLASILIAIGVWLPLILINLHRPIVMAIVTIIAFFCVRSFWREEFGESKPFDGRPAPWEGNYDDKDERDGYWIEWYDLDRKRKKSHAFYRSGRMISCEVWKPNGEKCRETKVIDGNGLEVHYFDASFEKDGSFSKDFVWVYKDGKIDHEGSDKKNHPS